MVLFAADYLFTIMKNDIMTHITQTLLITVVFLMALFFSSGVIFAGEGETLNKNEEKGITTRDDTVILLQGMGRGRASLWVLDTRLKSAGYSTLSYPYTANSQSIDALAEQLCKFIREQVTTKRYHIIAHSLGNLIVRAAFRFEYPPGLGRIVMLAPPNQPADLARALRDNPIYQWFTGESGQQLGSDVFYESLPIPNVEFGVIAGDRGQSLILQEPNDGVISVETTKLAGMTDWVVVPQSHNFMMNSRMVAGLCMSFLEKGRFDLELIQSTEGQSLIGEDEPDGSTKP
jgi:triacylglycerol lipase